jgi:hypothetical protein
MDKGNCENYFVFPKITQQLKFIAIVGRKTLEIFLTVVDIAYKVT